MPDRISASCGHLFFTERHRNQGLPGWFQHAVKLSDDQLIPKLLRLCGLGLRKRFFILAVAVSCRQKSV